MNGPLYMQGSAPNVVLVRRLKRKDESAWKQLSRWFVENQIGRPATLLPLKLLFDALPSWRRLAHNKDQI